VDTIVTFITSPIAIFVYIVTGIVVWSLICLGIIYLLYLTILEIFRAGWHTVLVIHDAKNDGRLKDLTFIRLFASVWGLFFSEFACDYYDRKTIAGGRVVAYRPWREPTH
jgi:hypothetical protein